MNPELTTYIAACRTAGMSDESIRQALISAGWQLELVSVALPIQVKRTLKSWVVISVSALVLIIIFSGISVTLGEAGYFPLGSKVYRKLLIPLAWKGTTGNSALSLAQGLSNTSSQEKIKGEVHSVGTVTLSEGSSNILGSLIPINKTSIGTFADIPASTSSAVDLTLSFSVDPTKGAQAGVSAKVDYPAQIKDLINPNLGPITANIVFPASGEEFYWRTNVIPVPTKADSDRWQHQELSNAVKLTDARDQFDKALAPNNSDLKAIAKAVNGLTKDRGIVRRGGVPLAWYVTTLNPESVTALSENADLPQDVRAEFTSMKTGWKSGSITIDWYLTPRNPKLVEVHVVSDVTQDYGRVQLDTTLKLSYGDNLDINIPDKTKAWQSYSEYLGAVDAIYPDVYSGGIYDQQKVVDEIAGSLANDRIKARNAQAQGDAIELAKAVESYVNETVDGAPRSYPSTDSKYDRVDMAGCVLCGVENFALTLPLHSSITGQYVTYWSDGVHYRTATQVIDGNMATIGYFVVQDGVAGHLDSLPE